ncbi:hypothetical protein R5R35_012127 [Gryllus longicercus]|uniref:Accessory gland protein n=1 Tax=Gryllus longicercus TaxID=2509291 RepID=A0AAN9VVD6_9ORTH
MAASALTVRRMSGCPMVSLAMLCLQFLSYTPLRIAAAPANDKPISGSAVTPNSLLPGLGGYPGYLGGSGIYPGQNGFYPGGIGSYPQRVLNPYAVQPPNSPIYGPASGNACMICSWKTTNLQWYLQNYGMYEQMGYNPCSICSYGI